MSDIQLGNLIWKITGNTTDFDKAITSTEKKAQGFSGSLSKIGTVIKGALGVAAVKAVADVSKKLISAASDAEETASKFNVTFSSIKERADAVAESLSSGYGLSSKASQQLLGDTGDLLSGFGFTQEAALDMSEQVNKLAVDLASFTNYSGGAEGASKALTSGLLGEREAMKSLGIAITDADIKQLAKDQGIEGELDRQTTAMLTMQLALKQSKNAIGDFARTQDGFANKTRTVKAALEDLSVSTGRVLLPFATEAASSFESLVSSVNDILTPQGELISSTNGLKSASSNYNAIVKELNDNSGTLNDTERELLKTRQQLGAVQVRQALQEFAKDFEKTSKKITKLSAAEEKAEKERAAAIVLRNKLEAMSASEFAGYASLHNKELIGISTLEERRAFLIEKTNKTILSSDKKLQESAAKTEAAEATAKDVMQQVAEAVYDGTINIDAYKYSNKELYNQIMALVSGMEEYRKKQAEKDAAAKKAAAEEERIAKAEKERKRVLEEISALTGQVLSEEVTDRQKLLAQIKLLNSATFDTADAERDRAKAIAILLTRVAELNSKEEESNEKVSEDQQKLIDQIHELTRGYGETADEQKKSWEEAIDGADLTIEKTKELKDELDKYYDALAKKEAWDNFVDNANDSYSQVSTLVSALASLSDALYQQQIDQLEAEKDAALEAAEEEGLSDEELADKQAAIEEEYADKEDAIEYEQELAAWKYDMLSAAGASALAILNAIAAGAKYGPAGMAAYGSIATLASAVQIAAVAAAKPVKAATGGVVPAAPGGTLIQAAENGGDELLLNNEQSGRAILDDFASRIASAGGTGGMINIVLDISGKTIAQAVAPYYNNGTVKLKV